MTRYFLLLFCTCTVLLTAGQSGYTDSLKQFRKNYTTTHEVVKGKDKSYFRFFPVSRRYAITCNFTPIADTVGFTMPTSGKISKHFFRYGRLDFTIGGRSLQLYVYQSKQLKDNPEYADYLFVPFTDATTGSQTYGSGRYIDLRMGDIKNGQVLLDFNKCYNPYCAYTTGYNCPVPPKENRLPVPVPAGEKTFAKSTH